MEAAARDPSYALAAAVAAVRYAALPPATLAAARRLVADSLAVAYAGAGGRDVAAVMALACEWGGEPQALLLATRRRAPAPVAAFVNGTLIQALDYDDTDDASAAHTASTVLAAALALGESRGVHGRELLAALVAGVEVVVRLGRASFENLGFTSTSLYGAFGAAAAAARILGLDAEATRHAFGIVISQAAGTTQTALDWPLSKHMQSGFAAQAGVTAALLAARGVSGVEHVFAGKYGFFNLYKGGRARLEVLTAPWGPAYAVEALSLKPYPSCRATHGPIEAAEEMAARAGFTADAVADVHVTVPRMAFTLAGAPMAPGRDPVIAAQFSIAYTVAAALRHGRLSLAHFHPHAIADPAVQALAGRVYVAPAGEGDFVPAAVRVTMRDGGVHEATVVCLAGSPERPLDEAAIGQKVRDCLAFAPAGSTALDAGALLDLAARIDEMPVRAFAARLAAPAEMPVPASAAAA